MISYAERVVDMVKVLYQGVKDNIKQKIINNEYLTGAKLPSEPLLQDSYEVSRVTIRKAIDQLVQEGYVTRIQGKGTFVNETKKVKRLMRHSAVESFSTIAEQNGLSATTKVVAVKKTDVPAKMQRNFVGPALNVQRLRYVSSTPLIIENNFFPLPRFAHLTNYDLTKSLYQCFYSEYDIKKIISKKATVSMIQADNEKASQLNCSFGFPLFLLDTVITDEEGSVIQAAEEFILSSMYQFEL